MNPEASQMYSRQTAKDYSSQSGKELIQLICLEDDHKAFEHLFNRFYPLLCQQVYSIVSCEHRAEEIVSDVFMKMWNNRHRLHIRSSLKAYLFTAVRNQAIDYLRKQAKHRKIDGELNRAVEAPYGSPEEEVIFEEVHSIVESAIDSLPPQGRHIFRLSRDEGLKYREIACQLNISIKTVETHMRRSLIFLRKELGVQLSR